MDDGLRPRKKGAIAKLFTSVNNNSIPSLNEQNNYNPDIRDWEHRKERLKDKS